jgi:hypothetical protein
MPGKLEVDGVVNANLPSQHYLNIKSLTKNDQKNLTGFFLIWKTIFKRASIDFRFGSITFSMINIANVLYQLYWYFIIHINIS